MNEIAIKLYDNIIKDARNKLIHKILLMYKIEGQLCDDIIYTIGKELIDGFNYEIKKEPFIESDSGYNYYNRYIWNNTLTRYTYDLPNEIRIYYGKNTQIVVYYSNSRLFEYCTNDKPSIIFYDYNDISKPLLII